MRTQLRDRLLGSSGPPLVMGVLNVTADSFSDGGAHLKLPDALGRGLEMIEEGADIIDVGAESTRPGAHEVPAEQQIARAVPVIEAINEADPEAVISIDTRLAPVAEAALNVGATMINDVSALRDDPAMAKLVATSGVFVCLMHRRGKPTDMQRGGGPLYDDVIGEIRAFLSERVQYAVASGVDESRIIVDPGIGFGKRLEHNLLILKHLDRVVKLGRPVLVGASRKSFIGTVLGIDDPRRREAGSLACAAVATLAGAAIIRAHDVRPTVEAICLCSAVRRAH